MAKKPKQKKMSAEQFKAARQALYDSFGGVKKKQFKELSPRLQYETDRGSARYQSLQTLAPAVHGRNTVMSPENLAKESPEVREEIIRKSQRLVPLYSKGPVQFMTDDADPHDAGKKK